MASRAVFGALPQGWRRAATALSLLWLATMASAGMVFVTQTVLARQLGPSAYGLFASSLATVTMIAPMAGFGLSQFRLKVYGTEGWAADRWLRPSMHFNAITTLLAVAIVVVWAFTLAPTPETRFALLLLSPVIVGLLAIDLVTSKLRLEERYQALALWQVLMPAGRLLVAAAVLLMPALSAGFVVLGYCACAVVVGALALPHLQQMGRGEMKLHGHGPRDPQAAPAVSPGVGEIWSQAWPFGLAAVLYPVFFQVSTVLLKYLGSDAEAGRYGVAMAVMMAIYLIPTTIYQRFLLSKLHRWSVHDRPKFWMVYRKGVIAMPLLGLLIGAVMAISAMWLVPLVFGRDYRVVVDILMVLAICVPIRFLSTSVGSILLTSTHMHYRVWAMGLAALVTIALNVLLIPAHHELGAAYATVGGEIVLFLSMWRGARKYSAEFR